MTAQFQIKHIANTDINNPEEALVPSLELALIEDLNSDDRGIFHLAINRKQRRQVV
jgi:hypothetical protein